MPYFKNNAVRKVALVDLLIAGWPQTFNVSKTRHLRSPISKVRLYALLLFKGEKYFPNLFKYKRTA